MYHHHLPPISYQDSNVITIHIHYSITIASSVVFPSKLGNILADVRENLNFACPIFFASLQVG
jgi:hypothetical protein